MAYRKLNKNELEILYKNLRGYFVEEDYKGVASIVSKYFLNPVSILVTVDSEYNDNTYDNKAGSVYVYDKDDVEIGLSRSGREEFNKEIEAHLDQLVPYDSEEPLENIVIYVNKQLPEIYIKEK